MLWGVGTGRSGTKSLATALGGEHEGVPYLRGEAAAWARGQSVEGELRGILAARLASGARVWVDFKQSYCVDLIREVDARAEIVWVIRHPLLTVASLVAAGYWHAGDPVGDWFLGAEGWRAQPRVRTALNVWKCTTERLLAAGRELRIVRCEDLPVHVNQRTTDEPVLTGRDALQIAEETRELWAETLARPARFGPLQRSVIPPAVSASSAPCFARSSRGDASGGAPRGARHRRDPSGAPRLACS